VLAATTPARFESGRDALRRLARALPLYAAGAGATPAFATDTGARVLDVDPLAAADHGATARRAWPSLTPGAWYGPAASAP
jgi:hypothetical protein